MSESKNLASNYLVSQMSRIEDPFDLAITAYAILTIGNQPPAASSQAMSKLRQKKRKSTECNTCISLNTTAIFI